MLFVSQSWVSGGSGNFWKKGSGELLAANTYHLYQHHHHQITRGMFTPACNGDLGEASPGSPVSTAVPTSFG